MRNIKLKDFIANLGCICVFVYTSNDVFCMRGAFRVVSTNQHLVVLIPKPNTEGIIYRRCLLSARDFRANDRTSPIHNIMAAGMYWTLD